jgi:Holliday junction resolvase RusA-like endonuclease
MFDQHEMETIRRLASAENDELSRRLVAKVDAFQGKWLKLALPLPPSEAHPNARSHRQVKAKAIAKYRTTAGEHAAIQMMQAKVPKKPQWSEAMVLLEFWRARKNQTLSDPDNLIAWSKSAIDALQDAGVLRDDRRLHYLPPQELVGVGTKKAQLFVYIAPLGEA